MATPASGTTGRRSRRPSTRSRRPAPVAGTSIKNLRMRDNLGDPGTDLDTGTAGYQTRVPVVTWDPVPGASSYELQVASWTGSACSWATSTYIKKTSVPSWTPFANSAGNPVVWQGALAEDITQVTPGTYCFRVRARSDRAAGTEEVYGDYTYLQDGTTGSAAPAGPAFTWTAYPDPTDPAASAGCASGYLCLADYREPVTGSTNGSTPLFTWKPLAGANSYFVVVAKDQNFSNVVDEGFTRIPAYSPRNSLRPDDLHRRDDELLLGRAPRQRSRRRRRASPRRLPLESVELPEAVDAADARSRPAASRSSSTSRPSAGRRLWVRGATGSRSRRTRPSATRSTTSSPTPPRTRATRPIRPTPSSTGASVPTTRT